MCGEILSSDNLAAELGSSVDNEVWFAKEISGLTVNRPWNLLCMTWVKLFIRGE